MNDVAKYLAAVAQLQACERVLLTSRDGELVAYAVRGKLEALAIINATK